MLLKSQARPLSGRATACSPGRSEAEPWEGMLLKSPSPPAFGAGDSL